MSESKHRAEMKLRRGFLRALGVAGAFFSWGFAIALTQACSSSSSATVVDSGACDPIAMEVDAAYAQCSRVRFVELPCGFPSGIQVLPVINPGVCQFNTNDCQTVCGGPYAFCFAFGSACLSDGGVVDSKDGSPVVECGGPCSDLSR